MNRRSLLAALGAAAAAGSTGCLADSGAGDPGDGGSPPTDGNGTETPPPTDATPTTTAGDAQTPPHDAEFPHGRDDVDEVVWEREVSGPDSTLLLEGFASEATLPAEIGFRLSNGTDRAFHTNFYDWSLHRWESGRWHRTAPTAVPEPLMTVPPGEAHEWTLTLTNEGLDDPLLRSEGTEAITVRGVGGGPYAFAAEGWWDDQEQTPTYEHQTVCAARFQLDGDALPLEPSRAVTDSRRDGDSVTVAAENPRTDEGDEATYVLTRDDDAADPRTLITEQVYRQWPLRDALAHAEPDVAEVRVETTTGSTPPFGVRGDGPAIEYDGHTYRVSAETPDGE